MNDIPTKCVFCGTPCGTARAATIAVEMLQKAQRYDMDPMGDYYQGEGMVHRDSGDWIAIDDVLKAIEILKDSK
jgi:hypothetical protein